MRKLIKILLIDDDLITNYLNKGLIEHYNIAKEVVIKNNGRDALYYLMRECKISNQYPDLILLDLKMPIINGLEFLNEFQRVSHNIKKDIVEVILTSSKDPDDVMTLKNKGNYFYVNKPLTGEKLLDIHHKYFRNQATDYQLA
jgi:CheY-like chemotaxis protein